MVFQIELSYLILLTHTLKTHVRKNFQMNNQHKSFGTQISFVIIPSYLTRCSDIPISRVVQLAHCSDFRDLEFLWPSDV